MDKNPARGKGGHFGQAHPDWDSAAGADRQRIPERCADARSGSGSGVRSAQKVRGCPKRQRVPNWFCRQRERRPLWAGASGLGFCCRCGPAANSRKVRGCPERQRIRGPARPKTYADAQNGSGSEVRTAQKRTRMPKAAADQSARPEGARMPKAAACTQLVPPPAGKATTLGRRIRIGILLPVRTGSEFPKGARMPKAAAFTQLVLPPAGKATTLGRRIRIGNLLPVRTGSEFPKGARMPKAAADQGSGPPEGCADAQNGSRTRSRRGPWPC